MCLHSYQIHFVIKGIWPFSTIKRMGFIMKPKHKVFYKPYILGEGFLPDQSICIHTSRSSISLLAPPYEFHICDWRGTEEYEICGRVVVKLQQGVSISVHVDFSSHSKGADPGSSDPGSSVLRY